MARGRSLCVVGWASLVLGLGGASAAPTAGVGPTKVPLVAVDVDGENRWLIAPDMSLPSGGFFIVSPDRRRVAYHNRPAEGGGLLDLWVADLDDRSVQRVAEATTAGAWLKTGILAVGTRAGRSLNLLLQPGERESVIPLPKPVRGADWLYPIGSPTGTLFAYQKAPALEFVVADATGAVQWRRKGSVWEGGWSADGRRIAYVTGLTLPYPIKSRPGPRVTVATARGRPLRTFVGCGTRWAAFSRELLVHRLDRSGRCGSVALRANLDTGATVAVTRETVEGPGGLAAFGSPVKWRKFGGPIHSLPVAGHPIEWSPDGHRLLVATPRAIWVADIRTSWSTG